MDRAFDRVLLARHFALSAGAIAAYVFRAELRIGYVALWIVGISATLNFLAYTFRTRPGMARLSYFASPVIGVGGWSSLVFVTSGVSSPFMAGLWLEIVLSAMALQPRMIAGVTIASVVALWVQQALLGLQGQGLAMLLQTGFLLGMGMATFLVTRRWLLRQDSITREKAHLVERLDDLTRQLEDERTVAALGENVARLAHGLKNTVHSLRGFVRLIEPRIQERSEGRAALEGLRASIDDLEALAHLTLGSDRVGGDAPRRRPGAAEPAGRPGDAGLPGALRRAVEEVATAHPDVEWETKSDGVNPRLPLPDTSFTETLVILMRNAVEAMDGKGRASVESWVAEGWLHVRITDEGRGFGEIDVNDIFKPGYTTKQGGSGYGLFLARRILEEHGGGIAARSREGRGAVVEVTLPLEDAAAARSAR
jgi:signal transduction histidine kinase